MSLLESFFADELQASKGSGVIDGRIAVAPGDSDSWQTFDCADSHGSHGSHDSHDSHTSMHSSYK
jgi:hypothetical protein